MIPPSPGQEDYRLHTEVKEKPRYTSRRKKTLEM